jgi:hypothetical protein
MIEGDPPDGCLGEVSAVERNFREQIEDAKNHVQPAELPVDLGEGSDPRR